jgi:hypothetical protein
VTRRRPEVQRCGKRHEPYLSCSVCWPIPPEQPERLQGPEVGTECIYHSSYPRFDSRHVIVIERSYVWAPNDPAYHGGGRRYDWKVVRFLDDNSRLCVDDKDLESVL